MGVLGMLAASCSQDADDPTQTESRAEKLQVYFTLDLGENGMDSRATWDGYDQHDTTQATDAEAGQGLETAVNDIQVLLFANDDDNTFLGKAFVTMLTPESASHLYTFYGELPTIPTGFTIMDNNNNLNCKLMILANCPEVTGLTVGTSVIENDVLKNITYSFDGTTNEIPMWGVLKATPTDAIKMQEGGFPNPLPDIYLIRAMAKIEITLDEAMSDYMLNSVKLSKANPKGYCIPTGYESVTTTKGLDLAGCMNAYTKSETETYLTELTFLQNASGGWYIYVPECDITGDDYLEFELDFGNDVKKTFKHGNYNTTGVYQNSNDVIRNYYYKYNIIGINDGTDLEVIITIKAWNKRFMTYPAQGLVNS